MFKTPSSLSEREKNKFCFLPLLIIQVAAHKNLREQRIKFGLLFLCSHITDQHDKVAVTRNTLARWSCNIISTWRDSPWQRKKRQSPGFYIANSWCCSGKSCRAAPQKLSTCRGQNASAMYWGHPGQKSQRRLCSAKGNCLIKAIS